MPLDLDTSKPQRHSRPVSGTGGHSGAGTGQLISVLDRDGRFTYVNDAYCQVSGYSRDELIGQNDQLLMHQDMPAKVKKELQDNIDKGYSWRGVWRNKTRSGGDFWIDTFITPQYQNGEIIGYQAISTLASADLIKRADEIYQALNNNSQWVTYEFSRYQKFILLIVVSLLVQGFIVYYEGWFISLIAAVAAVTPIAIFWQDIVPMAQRAQHMQKTFDAVSRYIYHGKGTASVFDFNLGMLKAKIKAILERSSDASAPLIKVVDEVQQDMDDSRNSIASQKEQIIQVSSAMLQMQSASAEIANSTVSTAEDVENTREQCAQVRDGISDTTNKIKALAEDVDAAASSADKLSQEAKNVGDLMENIQSIADQTNLLALNAAIEAARAGSHGRGFAVVADEVRSLSTRTQEAAVQIHERLSTMLNTISEWVEVMDTNKQQAEQCVSTVAESDEAMVRVYENIQHIAALAAQIATAAQEQGAVADEINGNVASLNESSDLIWDQTEHVHGQMVVLKDNVVEIASLAETFMPKKR